MEMESLVQAVSTVGFPVLVSLYVLVRLETAIKELTKVVTILATRSGVNTNE
jgi:hypothetical protein